MRKKTAYLLAQYLENNSEQIIQTTEDLIQVSRERGMKSIELFSSLILGRAQLKSGLVQPAIASLNYVVEQTEKVPYIWLAIEAIIDLYNANHQTGKIDSILPAKLHDILERIDGNIQKPGLREAFETYKNEMLTHVN